MPNLVLYPPPSVGRALGLGWLRSAAFCANDDCREPDLSTGLAAFFLKISQLAFDGGMCEEGDAHEHCASRDHADSDKIDNNVSHVFFQENPQPSRSTGVLVTTAIFYLGRTARHSRSPFVS